MSACVSPASRRASAALRTIGRIYERGGFQDEVRLFWPLHREPFCQTAPQRAWRERTSLSLRFSILDTVCRARLERSSRFGIR